MSSEQDISSTNTLDNLRMMFRNISLKMKEVSRELQVQNSQANVAFEIETAQEKILDQLSAQLYDIGENILNCESLSKEILLAKAEVSTTSSQTPFNLSDEIDPDDHANLDRSSLRTRHINCDRCKSSSAPIRRRPASRSNSTAELPVAASRLSIGSSQAPLDGQLLVFRCSHRSF
jgi:hypothetical protein